MSEIVGRDASVRTCRGLVTTLAVVPVGGLSNRLKRNISWSTREIAVLTVERGIEPFWTAVISACPK